MELVSKGETPSGCIFCELPLARDDRRNLVLGRTGRTFAMLNKYPYNNGHLMVIPRAHASDVHALSSDDYQELCEMLRVALRLVGRVAGAGIADHLNWHVVPRWGGDTHFMPVLADTKVMIEHLNGIWDRLRPLFDAEYRRGAPVAS